MTASEIKNKLRAPFHGIFVDEFTFRDKRIDAIIIDIRHRQIRGFEIKTKRGDFLRDKKWTEYSSFLSSLSIVCPDGLILPEEIGAPFGLAWVSPTTFCWKKRPRNFQERRSLAWFWTYLQVIETEFIRYNALNYVLFFENERLRQQLAEQQEKILQEER